MYTYMIVYSYEPRPGVDRVSNGFLDFESEITEEDIKDLINLLIRKHGTGNLAILNIVPVPGGKGVPS